MEKPAKNSRGVALVPCKDYSEAQEAIRECVRLLEEDFRRCLFPGTALVKPNFLKASRPCEAIVTHPDFVAALLQVLEETSYHPAKLSLGDSPAWGTLEGVLNKSGYRDILEARGVEIARFAQTRRVSLPSGRSLKKIHLAKAALEADLIINCPKLKAHCQMFFTGAVKNLFGCVAGKRKPVYHCLVNNSRVKFAHLLLDIQEMLPPQMVFMDAVVSMEGDGPAKGDPKHTGFILAGTNPLAVDILASYLVGYDEATTPLAVAARERGLPSRIEEIRVLGEKPERFLQKDFKKPQMVDISFNPVRVAWSVIKGQVSRFTSAVYSN